LIFFRKFAEIFAIQGAPPVSTTPPAKLSLVSTTPAANFSTRFASVVDTGGKANLPLVSTMPVANCHRCRLHRWQTMGAIIKLLTTLNELVKKMYMLTLLPKGVQKKSKQNFD
jgi:hypothetical protein